MAAFASLTVACPVCSESIEVAVTSDGKKPRYVFDEHGPRLELQLTYDTRPLATHASTHGFRPAKATDSDTL